MSRITFRQVSADEARIHDADGDYVGDVFRQADILHQGEYFYVVHLSEDPAVGSGCTTAPASARWRSIASTPTP